MAAVDSGAVDGFASDKLLQIGATNANAAAYTMLPENLSYEPYAIALPRGDWAFRHWGNLFPVFPKPTCRAMRRPPTK